MTFNKSYLLYDPHFLVCATMDSIRRKLKNLPILKYDDQDIDSDDDDTNEFQVHSDPLNERLRGRT
jgi:hypothetical protein